MRIALSTPVVHTPSPGPGTASGLVPSVPTGGGWPSDDAARLFMPDARAVGANGIYANGESELMLTFLRPERAALARSIFAERADMPGGQVAIRVVDMGHVAPTPSRDLPALAALAGTLPGVSSSRIAGTTAAPTVEITALTEDRAATLRRVLATSFAGAAVTIGVAR